MRQLTGYIYSITNKINGKQYIGQTTKTIEFRWNTHRASAKIGINNVFYKAIQKYGVENFEIKQLSKVNSPNLIDWLNILEPLYIKFYKTLVPNGYNLQTGGKNYIRHEDTKIKIGNSVKGRKHSLETIEKIRQSNLGKTRSDETKLKIKESHSHPWLDKHHTEETKIKQSLAKVGKKRSKKIKQKISESQKIAWKKRKKNE